MKIQLVIILSSLVFTFSQCQSTDPKVQYCQDEDFNLLVHNYLDYSVDVISVNQLLDLEDNYLLLDAREEEEFNVSHIPGAKYIGYKNPHLEVLKDIDHNRKIILYCSIGYRSEKIGIKLSKKGFTDISNLYGSIFEWVNTGQELESIDGKPTKKIHAYNKSWSKWILNKDYELVY